ncbi:MAG TPA: GNAT family N-acetyltransferase [Epulopiscium sp.]|nr:GNAT family N-acetyltransferase [Candidatus Epulonipiscium sp.]
MDDIKINITSSRSLDPTILKTSFDEWYEELEPSDQHLIRFNVQIYSVDEYGEKTDDVGHMQGDFFDLEYGMSEEAYYFFMLCDSVSQDLSNMASSIINKDGCIQEYICGPDEKLLYLDKLYIEPKYRNMGIGSYVINEIKELLEYCCQISPDVAVLLPSPQEKINGKIVTIKDNKEYDDKKNQLIQLYKSCGFQKIANEDFMFKKL